MTTRAALVGLLTRASRLEDPETSLDELAGLATAAGAEVVLRAVQERATPDSTTFIGKGKAEQLALACAEVDATLAVFDNELTPAQARNLEKVLGVRILDRTQLILDIFARRARTKEGKLQVELAQLQYLLPRLVGSSEALSRLGGGIGTRGPGETKLETDRRRIRDRIASLKRDIADVARRRSHLRTRRGRSEVPTIALVGYTNAGKSTLFNLLTGGTAVASDALFVTLDPLLRRVKLGDARQLMVSDTVGFIDRLPHNLVAAFRGTLEEVVNADLLIHVIDAGVRDRELRTKAVRAVLDEVGAAEVPILDVFNKIDAVDDLELAQLRRHHPTAMFISAKQGRGKDELVAALSELVAMDSQRMRLEFDQRREADRKLVADLYRHARVVSHVTKDDRMAIEADVPRRLMSRFDRAVRGA